MHVFGLKGQSIRRKFSPKTQTTVGGSLHCRFFLILETCTLLLLILSYIATELQDCGALLMSGPIRWEDLESDETIVNQKDAILDHLKHLQQKKNGFTSKAK